MAKPKMKGSAAQELADFIRDNPGGTLTVEKIDQICGTASSKLQYILLIGPLVKDGILVPNTEGGAPYRGNEQEPVYRSYAIAAQIPSSLPHSHQVMDGSATVDKKYRQEQMQRAAAERQFNATGKVDPSLVEAINAAETERLFASVAESDPDDDLRPTEGQLQLDLEGEAEPIEVEASIVVAPSEAEEVVPPAVVPKPETPLVLEKELPAPEISPEAPKRPAPQQAKPEQKQAAPQQAPTPQKQQPQQKAKQKPAKQSPQKPLPKQLSGISRELTQDGYLAGHLTAATGWKKELLQLGAWLKDNPEPPAPAILEERSFEVFGNEKVLGPKGEKRGGITLPALISALGVHKRLNIMDDPFNELIYYVPKTLRRTIWVLVVENHAPFVHIQQALAQGKRTFFGHHVDGVIYGEGYKVVFEDALGVTEGYFRQGKTVRYLYWGDIDRPGIDVMERAGEGREMEPLVEAYEAMIEAVAGRELPASGARAMPQHMGIALASQLKPESLEIYMRVLAEGLRIPQEAVAPSAIKGPEKTKKISIPRLRPLPKLPKGGA